MLIYLFRSVLKHGFTLINKFIACVKQYATALVILLLLTHTKDKMAKLLSFVVASLLVVSIALLKPSTVSTSTTTLL